MALTVANVSTPNAPITEGVFLHYKARLLDVTADASYPTAGYPITAASLGWQAIVGCIVLEGWKNAGRTQFAPINCYTNAAQTSLFIQLVNENDAAAYAQRPKEFEAVAASAQTGFSARIAVIGY